MSKSKPANLPRFGWATDLDDTPIIVCKDKPTFKFPGVSYGYVAVIPLPFSSAKMRAKVLAAAKSLSSPSK